MGEETAVPSAPNPSGPGAVDQGKAQLDALLKRLIGQSQAPTLGMPKPQPQFSEDSMSRRGYDTHHESNKLADIGQAMGNMGTFIHNMVAQHKQNQMRDAMSEWQGMDQALEKAQVLAGDPTAPDYKQKVQQALESDPWIKANLDPQNPKAVKRLKNMYKALNVDMLDDKDNVHRAGLKQMFKAKAAFDKVKAAKAKMMGQQAPQQSPQQQPEQRKSDLHSAVSGLMNKAIPSAPDPKGMEAAARLGVEHEKAEADSVQYMAVTKPDGSTSIVALDKKVPAGQDPQAREVKIDDGKGGKSTIKPIYKKPETRLIDEGIALEEKGDHAGAQAKFALANKAALAGKIGSPTLMDMEIKAQAGDATAKKDLAAYVATMKEIQGSRGIAAMRERAKFNLNQYVNPETHQLEVMSDMDAAIRLANGEHLIKTQALSTQTIIGAQRMQKEGTPAIKEMRKFTSAYDNPKDRAIMAEIAKHVGPASGEDPTGWMMNVVQQEIQQQELFSPAGRQLILRQKRLAEVLGTARQSLGALATNSGVALAMGLMPGANMPDSKMANDSLDQLQAILENSLSTEALKDVTSGSLSDDSGPISDPKDVRPPD